ncbi:putative protein OS=Streptomyces glaucescens OX=1907 GN=SGLAU_02790 PE=4 SV=1 [Streptomyces glaucescens]
MAARGFRPTHVVPRHGLPSWETPAPDRPTVPLDPLLPVQLVERRGDWGRIRCSNGWSAWIDGRRLVAVPQDPPTLDRRLAPTATPVRCSAGPSRRSPVTGPPWKSWRTTSWTASRSGSAPAGCGSASSSTGESVWLYDAERERWSYSDGTGLNTYAADEEPRPAEHPREEGAEREEREEPEEGEEGHWESERVPPYRRDRGYGTDPGHAPTRLVSPEDDL